MTRKLLTPPKTKVCTKCGKRKPLGEYHARREGKYGKHARCKDCASAEAAAWYVKNRGRVTATSAAWRVKNKDRAAAYYATWYAKNKERKAAACAAWYQANREDCILSAALYRDINGGF